MVDTSTANASPHEPHSFASLVALLKEFRDQRDWAKFHSAKNLAISISVEAAELLEHFQWSDESDITLHLQTAIEDEVADVLIYLILFAEKMNIDLVKAAGAKIRKNEKRFPIEQSRGISKPIDQAGLKK